ncbi:MAG: YlmH/Sll1252 family protein [Eubacteriales bacterium]
MTDKKRLIEGLSQSDEDKILLARVYDRVHSGIQKSVATASCFLAPRERALAEQLLAYDNPTFWGGYEEPERVVCCHVPDYFEPSEWLIGEDAPVVALRATYFAKDEITHRDILGSLMGEGIKREAVGDILVGVGQCDLLVTREIAPYLLQNWMSAGRTKFRLAEIPLGDIALPVVSTKTVRGTVATLRLDGVVAESFGLSRGKASGFINGGKVTVNSLPCEKTDRQVAEGDTIALRGMGKIVLETVGNTTKKGRIAIEIKKFA